MSDVLDILEVERGSAPTEITKERIMGVPKKRSIQKTSRRPEGINRELYNLLCGDGKDPAPLMPTDLANQGYKQNKARLGLRRVRPWKWSPFVNPARTDGLTLCHWRRVADADKEYPFAKFNKRVEVPTFSDSEYQQHLQADSWSKAETEHLLDLCSRFDLRFTVIQDRWDRFTFSSRSIEDLKERFYGIGNTLAKIRSDGEDTKLKEFIYDAAHERKRKLQLKRLLERSPEQVEEEQQLLAELRKIEARKRERERKTQDLQKLINSADTEQRKSQKAASKLASKKKSLQPSTKAPKERVSSCQTAAVDDTSKPVETRASGVSLRSQRLKMPASVGMKKAKALDQLVVELGIEANPMPTSDICTKFCELRNDMLLLYELKMALSSCEFELQSLKHQYEAVAPGKTLDIPAAIASSCLDINRPKTISQVLDIHSGQGTPTRKRKAALEQSKVLTKIKART